MIIENKWYNQSDDKILMLRKLPELNAFEVVRVDSAEENCSQLIPSAVGSGDVRFLHTVVFPDDLNENVRDIIAGWYGFSSYTEFVTDAKDQDNEMLFAAYWASNLDDSILLSEQEAIERVQRITGDSSITSIL